MGKYIAFGRIAPAARGGVLLASARVVGYHGGGRRCGAAGSSRFLAGAAGAPEGHT